MSKYYSSRSNRRRFAPARGNEGEFLWLVSLSDLMILLFIFFVVLFSFSSKNMSAETVANIQNLFRGETQSEAVPNLDQIQARLLKWTVDKKLTENFRLEKKEDALILQIKEDALFESGNSELSQASQQWVRSVGDFLQKVPAPYRIGIEGHTDDQPLGGGTQALDNWDLSGRRAHAVLKALGLSDEQLKRTVLMSFGETRPLYPNRDKDGNAIASNQARNRRVSIRIF